VDVQQEPGSIVQTALVQPAADLDKIEDVLVIIDFRAVGRTDAGEAGVVDPGASDDPAGGDVP
jgi:hypothetical protein